MITKLQISLTYSEPIITELRVLCALFDEGMSYKKLSKAALCQFNHNHPILVESQNDVLWEGQGSKILTIHLPTMHPICSIFLSRMPPFGN